MNKKKKMNVTINQTLIINVSIAVIIGVTLAPAVSSLASGLLKLTVRPALRLIAPLEFRAFFVSAQSNIGSGTFSTSHVIEWPTAASFNLTATDLKFEIYPEVHFRFFSSNKYRYRFPYSFGKWLYPAEDMEIQLISEADNYKIISHLPLPGNPPRYQVDVTPLKPNTMYHRAVTIRPLKYFDNQIVTVRVYYEGTPHDAELHVSLPTPVAEMAPTK